MSGFEGLFAQAEKHFEKREFDLAKPIYSDALQAARTSDLKLEAATCLYRMADCAANRENRDSKEAFELYTCAIEELKILGSHRMLQECLYSRGIVLFDLQRFPAARQQFEEAITVSAAGFEADPMVLAECNYYIAECVAHDIEADHAVAFSALAKARDLFARAGEIGWEASCAFNLGLLHREQGNPDTALECWQEASRSFAQAGDRHSEAVSLRLAGAAAFDRGDLAKGMGLYQRALHLFQLGQEKHEQAQTLCEMGSAHQVRGERERAEASFTLAAQVYSQIGSSQGEAQARILLSDLYKESQQSSQAWAQLWLAYALYQKHQDRKNQAICLKLLAEAQPGPGPERSKIKTELRELEFEDSSRNPEDEAEVLYWTAECYLILGASIQASEVFHKALKLYRALSWNDGQAHCLVGLGKLAEQKRESSQSRMFFKQASELFERESLFLAAAQSAYWQGLASQALSEKGPAHQAFAHAKSLFNRFPDREEEVRECEKRIAELSA